MIKTSNKITALNIELAVAELLNPRIYTIVPNVSWGLYLNHECDMLALHKHRFTEIEIKISASDLKADFNKRHHHESKYISRLVYAVPEKLKTLALELCPRDTGIIVVQWIARYGYKASWERTCKHDPKKDLVPLNIQSQFMRLGCIRIWTMKRKINKQIKQKELWQE